MSKFIDQVIESLENSGFKVGKFETDNQVRVYINGIPNGNNKSFKKAKFFICWDQEEIELLPSDLSQADKGILTGGTLITYAKNDSTMWTGYSAICRSVFAYQAFKAGLIKTLPENMNEFMRQTGW